MMNKVKNTATDTGLRECVNQMFKGMKSKKDHDKKSTKLDNKINIDQ